VLGAGEELRPTGSDPTLLGRIADLTGGKRRDTLAGIFADRASRRFAYEDATPPLLVLAAFGLLLAVAARRLSLPDGVLAWSARLRAPRPREPRAEVSAQAAEATLGALLDARDRGVRLREDPEKQATPRPPPAPLPPGPRAPPPAMPPAPPAARRPLTAAEIVLARRKAKGP
jgi:hypothetical protein